ncbi:MAG: hypothetical protein JW958_09875 [Candidatus Eisenbacteria bacterium]|nr:hypothetical protein [Candidatus Eisenbacteria bacterium]
MRFLPAVARLLPTILLSFVLVSCGEDGSPTGTGEPEPVDSIRVRFVEPWDEEFDFCLDLYPNGFAEIYYRTVEGATGITHRLDFTLLDDSYRREISRSLGRLDRWSGAIDSAGVAPDVPSLAVLRGEGLPDTLRVPLEAPEDSGPSPEIDSLLAAADGLTALLRDLRMSVPWGLDQPFPLEESVIQVSRARLPSFCLGEAIEYIRIHDGIYVCAWRDRSTPDYRFPYVLPDSTREELVSCLPAVPYLQELYPERDGRPYQYIFEGDGERYGIDGEKGRFDQSLPKSYLMLGDIWDHIQYRNRHLQCYEEIPADAMWIRLERFGVSDTLEMRLWGEGSVAYEKTIWKDGVRERSSLTGNVDKDLHRSVSRRAELFPLLAEPVDIDPASPEDVEFFDYRFTLRIRGVEFPVAARAPEGSWLPVPLRIDSHPAVEEYRRRDPDREVSDLIWYFDRIEKDLTAVGAHGSGGGLIPPIDEG